jgi:hypothetical protein
MIYKDCGRIAEEQLDDLQIVGSIDNVVIIGERDFTNIPSLFATLHYIYIIYTHS